MKWFAFGLCLLQGVEAEAYASRSLSQFTQGYQAPRFWPGLPWNSYPSDLLSSLSLSSPKSFVPEVRFRPPRIASPSAYIPPPPQPELMCPGPAVGCFQGHLRHCTSATVKQDDAPIVRTCARGCRSCGTGVPDVCLTDRYEDVCALLRTADRETRTCTAAQERRTGCFGGPDVGYCFGGQVYLVDYCHSAGCTAATYAAGPDADQCNTQRPSTAPPSQSSYSTPPPSTDRSSPSQPQYVPPSSAPSPPLYVPPSPQYVPPSPQYVPPSPQYVAPSPQYVPPSPQYVPYVPPSSPPSPAPSLAPSAAPSFAPSRAPSPPPSAVYVPPSAAVYVPGNPTPARAAPSPASKPTQYRGPPVVVPPQQDICPGDTIICYEGHLRLCFRNMPKSFAFVIHDCRSKGCSSCPSGRPDMCNEDDGSSVCDKAPASQYLGRCSYELQASTSYCDGSNVRVCDPSGQATLVEYCATRGCERYPPQCVKPLPPAELCQGTRAICHQGHIRLCRDKEPIDRSDIIHNCRAQGCSQCENGPPICNNEQQQSQCSQVTPDRYSARCTPAQQETTYCAGADVRHCDSAGRGLLVEYCANRGCSSTPLACNPPAPAPTAPTNSQYYIPPITPTPSGKGKSQVPAPAPSSVVAPSRGQIPVPSPTPGQAAPTPGQPAPTPGQPAPTPGQPIPSPTQGKAAPTTARPAPTPGQPVPVPTPGQVSPPVTCGPRVRMEWGAMPDSARSQYIRALLTLYQRGDMTALAELHFNNKDAIHGDGVIQFLIWHRVFLLDFEERLRSLPGNECMTVPYWNYDYNNSPNDRRSVFGTSATKMGQGDRPDCIGGVFASITQSLEGPAGCIKRNPNRDITSVLANSMFVDLCQVGQEDPLAFASSLQNTHGYPHVGYGGEFSTHHSPIDPLFFIHHANIDRIWDLWQDCHSNYQWFEPGGLSAPVVYYGVRAGDFIDNSQTKWKGKTLSVSYSSDQFSNPEVYSSDFRRNILTRCRDGRLRRYTTPNPVLGVDDAWTRGFQDRSFVFMPGSSPPAPPPLNLQKETVTITCDNPAGTANISQLVTSAAPVALYDGFSVQECLTKCATFYWKASGESNCVCLTLADKTPAATVSLKDATIKQYQSSCAGPQTDYGLYRSPTQAGRRLQASFDGVLDGPVFPMPDPAADQDTTASAESEEFGPASSSNSTFTTSSPSVSAATRAPTSGSTSSPTPGANTSSPTIAPSAPTSSPTVDTSPAAVSVDLTAGAQRVCFESVSSSRNQTSIACSSRSVTPIPLPREWVEMNHLNPDNADACRNFQPAVGSKPVDCVNQ